MILTLTSRTLPSGNTSESVVSSSGGIGILFHFGGSLPGIILATACRVNAPTLLLVWWLTLVTLSELDTTSVVSQQAVLSKDFVKGLGWILRHFINTLIFIFFKITWLGLSSEFKFNLSRVAAA